MKVAVMGAGAVGGYYGGMLARAGHAVVMIGRPAHVAAMRERGLRLETAAFDEHLPVQASTEPSAVQGAELVLVGVKSTDTADAAAAIGPHLAPSAMVLSLQNGVDNAERLTARLGRTVKPAVVYVATEMAGPGHVKHHGRGELVIDAEPAAEAARLQALFAAAGVPVQTSDNVVGALWAKLILNCAYNALSALSQLPYGRLVQVPGIPAVMDEAVAECLAVAHAMGVRIPGDVPEAVARIAQTMAGQFSSTAQDVARGKPTEIDHLNGHVLRCGERLGVPTPVNRTLHALVKAVEARQAAG